MQIAQYFPKGFLITCLRRKTPPDGRSFSCTNEVSLIEYFAYKSLKCYLLPIGHRLHFKMDEQIIAEAILRSASGRPLTNTVPRADTIDHFKPDAHSVQHAVRIFHDLGVEVMQRGVVSITIRAPKSVLERLFQIQLYQVPTSDERLLTGGIKSTYYEALTDPIIPESLSPYVQTVILPKPASFGI